MRKPAILLFMVDYWKHEVRVEAISDADPKKPYPICTGGAGACPPEECGGPQCHLARRDEANGESTPNRDANRPDSIKNRDGAQIGKLQ
jgi:hypothetical protein